jgi:ribulose-phosphate 3-epimerase
MHKESIVIAPSLLSADVLNLQHEIQLITTAGANWLHIDVMDGHFVPNLAFGVESIHQIKQLSSLPIDVHLMIDCLPSVIDRFIEIQVDYLSIHPEATYHPYRYLQKIKNANIKAGIALNPGTSLDTVYPLLDQADMVLIMTVNPGFGGQQFLSAMLPKIRNLRKFIDSEKLAVKIEVDGGINDKTAPLVINAGADVLVAGHYLFQKQSIPQSQNQANIYTERIKTLLNRG